LLDIIGWNDQRDFLDEWRMDLERRTVARLSNFCSKERIAFRRDFSFFDSLFDKPVFFNKIRPLTYRWRFNTLQLRARKPDPRGH